MSIEVELSYVTGISLGGEYVAPEFTGTDRHHIVVDLLFVRFLISWPVETDKNRRK